MPVSCRTAIRDPQRQPAASGRWSRYHQTLGLLAAGVTAAGLGDRVRSQGSTAAGGLGREAWGIGRGQGRESPRTGGGSGQGSRGWRCRPARREGDSCGRGGGHYTTSGTPDRLVAEEVTERWSLGMSPTDLLSLTRPRTACSPRTPHMAVALPAVHNPQCKQVKGVSVNTLRSVPSLFTGEINIPCWGPWRTKWL